MKFISLENVLGKSNATSTTVALFNSVARVKINKENGKKYINVAVKPHLNGVLIEKQYLN